MWGENPLWKERGGSGGGSWGISETTAPPDPRGPRKNSPPHSIRDVSLCSFGGNLAFGVKPLTCSGHVAFNASHRCHRQFHAFLYIFNSLAVDSFSSQLPECFEGQRRRRPLVSKKRPWDPPLRNALTRPFPPPQHTQLPKPCHKNEK